VSSVRCGSRQLDFQRIEHEGGGRFDGDPRQTPDSGELRDVGHRHRPGIALAPGLPAIAAAGSAVAAHQSSQISVPSRSSGL